MLIARLDRPNAARQIDSLRREWIDLLLVVVVVTPTCIPFDNSERFPIVVGVGGDDDDQLRCPASSAPCSTEEALASSEMW